MTNRVQDRVLAVLRGYYPDQIMDFLFHVQPPKTKRKSKEEKDSDSESTSVGGEQTMRSRSFLFFALGIAVADAIGNHRNVVVAENGLISLNVPLTPARLGSCSTKTTHPHFINIFNELLRGIGMRSQLELPYRFMTKGEMLTKCRNQAVLRETAPLSMSCSHPEQGRFQGMSPDSHCGYCVPCIIRRAALSAAGLPIGEYRIDVNNGHFANKSDVRAFKHAIERSRSSSRLQRLTDVLSTGPLCPNEVQEFVRLHLRGTNEVARILNIEPVV